MNRDYDIVRKILIALEEHEGNDDFPREIEELELTDIDEKIFYYHTRLMTNDGLIEADREVDITSDDIFYKPIRLTNKGHDFLKYARNDTWWNKMKKQLGAMLKDTSLAVITAVLVEIAKGKF